MLIPLAYAKRRTAYALASDALKGSFLLSALNSAGARVTHLRGWERSRWWNSPMFFWDDFSADGELGPESNDPGPVGALSLGRTIAPGAHADYTFLLAWHFPNRTPRRCGWTVLQPLADGQTRRAQG